MNTIPIGITARNEARNILAMLESLRAAIRAASTDLGLNYQIHVLLNDNTDETPRLLADAGDVRVWNTYGGIIEAQRALVEHCAHSAPFLVFSDADILVDLASLTEISRVMIECPEVEVSYAAKIPIEPRRRTLLARALYFYNLREGYQTTRHYFNGQFFAIRRWQVPEAHQLEWDPAQDNPFLNLAAGIRVDDIYISRVLLRSAGPAAMRCVPSAIRYRPPETLTGMFRKYQRMCLELERMDAFFPDSRSAHRKWGRRRLDLERFSAAPSCEKFYYLIFRSALLLCRIAYRTQRAWYSSVAGSPCPTWQPVAETKEPLE